MFNTFLMFLSCVGAISDQDAPIVEIGQGVLRGKYLQGRNGKTFSAFTAIPYAKPPLGDLRFKAPVPAGTWDGIMDATKSHSACPQIFGVADVTGDEDCLYLNVYTPQKTIGTLLPVMVYIHGGAFAALSARQEDHGPDFFVDKDVVLVVLNYRLGALGFLSTGDEAAPGNNGLKDQNLAIKWTKRNVARFGGDPDRLTLFGQSAGGASVHFHLLSPLSKGLAQRAIAQSGTALSPRGLTPNDQGQRNSRKLAELLNCSRNSSEEMVECLRNRSVREIVVQQNKFNPWKIDRLSGFRPVVEPKIEGAFLSEHPADIYKSGKAENIPLLTGITTEDSAAKVPFLFNQPGLLEEFNRDFDTIAPITLLYEGTTENVTEVTEKIRQFYFGPGPINNCSRAQVIKMYMDGMLLTGADSAVNLHFAHVRAPLYYYLFGYRASVSFCDNLGDPYDYGVCHTDDLLHLFKVGFLPKYNLTEFDEKVMEVMLTLWTNFAKTGNPTPESDESTVPWKPVKSERLEYYFIRSDTDLKMADFMYEERVKFWRSLPIFELENVLGYEIDY